MAAQTEIPAHVERQNISRLSSAGSDNQEYDTDLDEAVEDFQMKLKTNYARTTKDIYLDACSQLDVTPVSKFLRHCTTPQVDLKHYGIGDKGARSMATALERDMTVKSLNLHDNGIRDQGTQYLSKMLTENCFITHIDLSGNAIGSDGTRAIGEMLWENGSLQELNLTSCGIQGKDVERFSKALGRNTRLKTLGCSYNDFGDTGGVFLGSALKSNRALQHLDLSWNSVGLIGVKALAKAIEVNEYIRVLDLSCNYFLDAGATTLGQALISNKSLKGLYISNCGVQSKGTIAMAKALGQNKSLEVLKIGKNPLQNAGVCRLLAAARDHQDSSLNEISFDSVVFDQDCKGELDRLLEVKPNFTCSWGASVRGKVTLGGSTTSTQTAEIFLAFVRRKGLRLIDLFKMIVSDPTSRIITKAEFIAGLKKLNAPMNDSQIRELYDCFDENGDGSVEFQEFHSARHVRRGAAKRHLLKKAFH